MDLPRQPVTTFTGAVPTTANPFAELPELLREILNNDATPEIVMAIEDQHGLTNEQCDAMMGVLRKVVLQTIRPSELVLALAKDVRLDEPQAKSLALDLLGWHFLPMEWYLGPIEPLIRDLGGDPEAYLELLQPIYPEVYGVAESEMPATAPTSSSVPTSVATSESPILKNIEERLTSTKGRAEVLLRLTNLSEQVEAANAAGHLSQGERDELLHTLDALGFAINTQDLNPLEMAAIKRRLKSVVQRLPTA